MLDITSMSTMLSSLKTLSEIAFAIKDVKDTALIETKLFELRREILSAQQAGISAKAAQNDLIEQVRQLRSKVENYEKWFEEEAVRYVMKDYGSETFAYELKLDCARGEPQHKLCPTCFNERRKSLLQRRGTNGFNQIMYHCMSCDQNFSLGERTEIDGNASPEVGGSWMSR